MRLAIYVAEGRTTLEAFMEQLSVDDLISLLCGQPNTGVANTYGFGNLPEYGVPNIMTAIWSGRSAYPSGSRRTHDCIPVCDAARFDVE